ncbi:alpha/beta hydrolase [Demequina pelophila]|uniref:alpha/beta hydrolase n=1 Tax=Demequina pelophila TaxID=1638984 RepID=UPI0007852D4D|nr:dienelactone hydrolase family protein [Demequina pelophila]
MTLTAVLSPSWTSSPAATPRVVLLHGFGSNERDLPSLAAWLPAHLPWASVRAPLEMGYGAAAWFPLDPSGAMDEHAITTATDALWDWIDAHVPDEAPVIPVGFSQGGLMALQLLRTRPARVLAPVVLAGFVGRDPQPADAELATSRPAVFWGRGDADPVIWPDAIARTQEFVDGHTTVTARLYPGLAHSVAQEEMDDVKAFLRAHI